MFADCIKKIKVKDIMKSKDIIIVKEDMLARDISTLFAEKNISGAPVINEYNDLVGVVSLSDISRSEAILDLRGVLELVFFNATDEIKTQVDKHLTENHRELVGRDIMTPNPITVHPEDSLEEAVKLMHSNKIHRLIVMNGTRIDGILSLTDFLNLFVG